MDPLPTGPETMRRKIDLFREYLMRKGLRSTEQRELIAQIFLKNQGHISTEDLYLQVKKKNPSIGFATVYRTIHLLAEAGLASVRSFGDGFARYETSDPERHHDHLICTSCGTIIEFENDQIESLQNRVAGKHQFEVHDHRLELYGICKKCRGL